MLLTTLILTWYMIGLAMFVQVIAYPQFARVRANDFAAYHRAHLRGTVWVIVPMMILELATGIAVVYQQVHAAWAWISLGLLAVVWIVTFGRAVPLHRRLERSYDTEQKTDIPAELVRRLVRVNAYRTVAWIARGLLLAWVMYPG